MIALPGPWGITIQPQDGTWVDTRIKAVTIDGAVRTKVGIGIAQIFGDSDEETEANARPIAASPDLLAACRKLVAIEGGSCCNYCGKHRTKCEPGCPVGMARAAIALAEGGES